jgi:hypothetical protein
MQIIAFLCNNYKYMQLNFLGFDMKRGVYTEAFGLVLFATDLSTDRAQSAKSAAFVEQNRQLVYNSGNTVLCEK